MNKLNVAYTIF